MHIQLIGPFKVWIDADVDLLPRLRKAGAIIAVLALTDGQSISRRQMARLLWSRSDPVQALARLRDTLHHLRRSLISKFTDFELVRVVGDQVSISANAAWVDVLEGTTDTGLSVFDPKQIAVDLEGIDPALDEWLATVRSSFLNRVKKQSADQNELLYDNELVDFGRHHRKGAIIGVCPLCTIGPGIDAHLPFALAEEIGTALTRLRGLIVVSNASVAGVLASGRSLRAELKLDYFLEGTLQSVGGRLRIVLKLVETEGEVVALVSQSDYSADDLFALQGEVAALIAATVEPEIPLLEADRIRREGSGARGAYGFVLKAISRIHLLERKSFFEAGDFLRRAMDLEPDYAASHAWLALWNIFLVGQGWAKNSQLSIAQAGEAAERAIMLDPNDARGLAIAGHVQAFLHHRLDKAMSLHERALAVNPNLPLAWHLSGVANAYLGNLENARKQLKRCRQLAPHDPHRFFPEGALIIVELLSRNHLAAVAIARRVTQLHPRFSAAYKPYLAALGHLGDQREAAIVYKRLLSLEPDFTVRRFKASSPFAVPEHLDHYVTGLRRAGVT